MMSPEELQDEELAGIFKLTTAMPLKIINEAMDPDLNVFVVPGFYYSKNKAAVHAPEPDLSWGLYIVSDGKDVSQTYQSNSGRWWRSSNSGSEGWGGWTSLINEPAMPLTTLTGTADLDNIHETGIYIGTEADAVHSPDTNGGWYLEVVAQPFQTTTRVFQTYTTLYSKWWRSSLNGGASWGGWRSLDGNQTAMPIVQNHSNDLNQLLTNGFFLSNNQAAVNTPNSTATTNWILLVNATGDFVVQSFYDDENIWWRRSLDKGSTWSDWSSLQNEPAMPLTILTGSVEINQIRKTGFYIGVYTVGDPDGPYQVGDGSFLEVLTQSNTIIQTFIDSGDRQTRSSIDGGETWTKWKFWQLNRSHMPTWTREEIFYPDQDADLNVMTANGFYMGVEPPRPAKNGPPESNSNLWSVMTTGSTIDYVPYVNFLLSQLYFDPNGIWYRTNTSMTTWTDWVSLIPESSVPKAYGSAYRLGDAVIAKDHFIPFTAMGPNSSCQLDTQTGELIVGQAGDYSVSFSLHLNNNQPASFAVSVDGSVPEHHPVLHYEHATSTYAGIQSAQVSGLIRCEAGQRIGVKNVTGQSVTLRHAVNGNKCNHQLTVTQVG